MPSGPTYVFTVIQVSELGPHWALCSRSEHYPNREPDTGLIQDAAVWIQELVMPDFSQRDIAQSISRWVVSQTELAQGGATIEQPQQNRFIGFM